MPIVLDTIELDPRFTGVREELEEVGGRNERRITLSGVIHDLAGRAAIEARLDAIVATASRADFSCPLSIREGRLLWVRRDQFVRAVSADPVVGSFSLRLLARDPLEDSVIEFNDSEAFTALPFALMLEVGGTAPTPCRIVLEAGSDLIGPSFSDGTRTLTYDGIVPDGATLLLDGETGRVHLDDEEVTAYTTGLFPIVVPGENEITLTAEGDDPVGTLAVFRRDRWW